MSKTNIEKIKSLFEKALNLSQSERKKFFDNLSEDDKKYVDEVKSLLDSYNTENDFLEITSQSSNSHLEPSKPHPLIGKQIGPYLIEEQIGIGGMGIVFSGKRTDGEFEQKVAIKIIKYGLSSDYILRRFQNERQTLANLQHANIARLLDGGKTSEELPYLIMEYIDGIPITEFCSKNNLTIKNKLKLFITVCRAVQYAHQNLVVHRDIKPGNILVDKNRNPKLLDFGVAKLLTTEYPGNNDDALTKAGVWHLTPEYASPEQINGSIITTASDIYSLGVLLYKLLTGEEPYKFQNNSPSAIIKVVTDEKITRPSEFLKNLFVDNNKSKIIATKATDYKQLEGDLDNIVLKAMHKDQSQRYASVQEFANDIQRYLEGHPVIARDDTIVYRLTKFVQRHKVGVAAFVLINLIILASISLVIYQGSIAADERDKARIENQKYEKVNEFLTSILSAVDPSEVGRDVKVYDILERVASDVENDFKGQPEIEASIKSTLGNAYVNLGEYEKGKPFLMEAFEINKNIYGEHSKEAAESIHDLALYYDWVGDYPIADSLYAKSITIFKQVLKEPSKIYADALNNHAIIKMNFGDNYEAQKLYLDAINTSKLVEGENNRTVAVMMNNLAISYMDTGKLDEAEVYYKASLKILIKLLGTDRPEVGSSYNNMAGIFMKKQQYDSAEVYLQKSYDLKFRLKGKDHPDVGLALNNLGVLEFYKMNIDKAENYFLQALDQYLKSYSMEHPLVGQIYYWLAKINLMKNKYSVAESQFRKSLAISKAKMPEDSWEIWRTKYELGLCLVKLNKSKEAEILLKESYNYYIEQEFQNQPAITEILNGFIDLYRKLNNVENLEKYKNLLEMFKKSSEKPQLPS